MKLDRSEYMISAYERYKDSSKDSLSKAYAKASKKKQDAWDYCKSLCSKYNGEGLRIVSNNVYKFSAGFVGYVKDENGQDRKVFVFITKSADRYMEV